MKHIDSRVQVLVLPFGGLKLGDWLYLHHLCQLSCGEGTGARGPLWSSATSGCVHTADPAASATSDGSLGNATLYCPKPYTVPCVIPPLQVWCPHSSWAGSRELQMWGPVGLADPRVKAMVLLMTIRATGGGVRVGRREIQPLFLCVKCS